MRFSRTGILGILASAVGSGRPGSVALQKAFCDPWRGHTEVLDHFPESRPSLTAALAASVVPFEHNPCSCPVEPQQTYIVTDHSIVVVVPPELGIERTKESLQWQTATFLAPLRKIGQGAV